MSRGAERPYTLVYDGSCRVCSRMVELLRRWDTEAMLEIAPSQQPGVQARFPWIAPEAYAQAVQLIGPGGRSWQGAAAIDQLLRLLPHGRWLGWAFRVPILGAGLDYLYRWFARNRYRFGCGEHCQFRPGGVDYGDADSA